MCTCTRISRVGATHVVDNEVHYGLGHEVALRFVDDAQVGVDEVADRLHLPLELRVHGAHLVTHLICGGHGGGKGEQLVLAKNSGAWRNEEGCLRCAFVG
jgi:hypothetical protein